MKKDLHPNVVECSVSCACGNTFTTTSTKDTIRVDICSACHPFYTGSERQVDTAGRIDKFKKRYQLS
jgi:large subunit ribosomal protein L31